MTNYTIDQTAQSVINLVLMYSPATFQECLIHSMDAYRKAGDLANNGDSSKSASNLAYAESKARMAIHFAKLNSRKRGAKDAIFEADTILILIDEARRVANELAA